jgi:hypothetical protein
MYQLVITNLKKYTNYSVKINCATKIGSGPWSAPIVYVQTLEDGNCFIGNIRRGTNRDSLSKSRQVSRGLTRLREVSQGPAKSCKLS